MTSDSAIQLISPAIERTRQYLFKPFRLGRFLKLTLVAVLTEGGMSSCNFNSGNSFGNSGSSHHPLHMPAIHWPAMPILLGILAVFLLVVVPIGILISYLLIRLRFSFFDCVLHNQDQIGPAWSRYHRQAMRYLGLTLCIGVAFWILIIPIGYVLVLHFKPLFLSLSSSTPPDFADFLPLIGIGLLIIMLLALVGYLVETTLSSFVLPRMALEDASIRDALEDVWSDIQSEPGPFALFVLFRFLVSMAGTIVALIALFIPIVIFAIIGVVLVLVLKAISTGLVVALGIPAGILAVALLIVAMIGLSGTIGTFRRNYAILFYAGRYPPLAMILWPPPPPAPAPPPTSTWDSGFIPGPVEGS